MYVLILALFIHFYFALYIYVIHVATHFEKKLWHAYLLLILHYSVRLAPQYCAFLCSIVRLLVATLHVGMTGKQDGGYTQ